MPLTDSDLDICTQALLLIGDETISSFDEENAKAKLCKNIYTQSRDALLRMHPWNFAVKRVTLGPVNIAPVSGYSYFFNFPEDCLRILSIDGCTDWKIEERKILVDSNTITVRYIYRNEDVSQYDVLFIETLIAFISYKLSFALTKSKTKTADQLKMFADMLRVAKNIDAMEEPQDTVGDFPFIAARSRL